MEPINELYTYYIDDTQSFCSSVELCDPIPEIQRITTDDLGKSYCKTVFVNNRKNHLETA
ncbi:MAG: hypothetical protein CVU57_16235 [Deltaproteobacteria bacterium HGW-Deltaproteobacteria-15]|jgi:hypothetical protein|nr:MAG: hypothetical protein CVU57_16235 [Deltaproteobacteria bacterium HGW-Deltaproteobacteria-15]